MEIKAMDEKQPPQRMSPGSIIGAIAIGATVGGIGSGMKGALAGGLLGLAILALACSTRDQ